jgi:hypothetical protein
MLNGRNRTRLPIDLNSVVRKRDALWLNGVRQTHTFHRLIRNLEDSGFMHKDFHLRLLHNTYRAKVL